MDQLEARTADGVTLRIGRVRAAGERRGVIVCLHAMMTDGRYFGGSREHTFAHTVAAAGFDVLIPDFRGHGRSVPPRAGPDDWSFDDLVTSDLPAIIDEVARASRCSPGELSILGHSLGGLVAIATLGTARIPPPRGLVVVASSVWLLGDHGPLARRVLMSALRGVANVWGRIPVRALRVGSADEPTTYIQQLTGWTRAARWTSLDGTDYVAAAASITAPIFPYAGTGDWMCTPEDASRFIEPLRTAEPLRIVGRVHGDVIDPDHFELFTRRELSPVWREIVERLENGPRVL